MPTVFVPKEKKVGERRVAATPLSVKRLVQEGYEVSVETGAGDASYFPDAEYSDVGATLIAEAEEGYQKADFVLAVNPPEETSLAKLKQGASLISHLFVGRDDAALAAVRAQGAQAFAINAVPRTTRAQRMDALSSQSNLAGYKAVLLGAARCPKIFPMLMTAAGTLRPSRVVILGGGVAGLQAVATARRLGAVVEVSDVRPAVKEQVESLGATFIELPESEDLEGEGGHAKQASEAFLKEQAAITRRHLLEADVVICTALIPGKKAPVLIKEDVVQDMKPGSVIVDLAAEQGGNCALTQAGEEIEAHGVIILGAVDVPGSLSINASEVYSRNILSVLLELVDKESNYVWRADDDIVERALLVGGTT